MTKARITMLVLVVLTAGIVGFIAYVHASIRHLGFLTTSDVKALMSAANEARAAVAQNKARVLPIDDSVNCVPPVLSRELLPLYR